MAVLMNKKLRLGLIGLGKMGMSHCAIVRSHPAVELAGVCDSSRYVLDVLEKHAGLNCFTDYKKLIRECALDGVIVATPSRSHEEIVRFALEGGLHVFCEKPFSLDPLEGRALAQLATEKGLVNQVGYHYRFVAAFQEAKRVIESGALGRIHHVRATAYGPVVLRPRGSTWRTTRSEGGGCLYDYASHAIDLINYLIARPESVSGVVLNNIFSRDTEDEVYATLHFADGASGQIAVNWSDDSYRKMTTQVNIWGTEGRISADRQECQIYLRNDPDPKLKLRQGWTVRYTTDLTEPVWYYLRGEEYSAQIDYFIHNIVEDRKGNLNSFASAVEADEVVKMMLQPAGSTKESDEERLRRGNQRSGPRSFLDRLIRR